jgi:hypothetical protein
MVTAAASRVPLYTRVPRLWPGGTILCVASGPSLTAEDVAYCRGKVDATIVINTSYRMVPWAEALYAADEHWWQWHKGVPAFEGVKFSVSHGAAKYGVSILRNAGSDGLEQSPDGLKTGRNSGFQAINLAVHFGATRIVLLGYDLQNGPNGKTHWHGDHPHGQPSPFGVFREKFQTLVEPLKDLGIEVVNCTPGSALKAFPQRPLREALP